MGGWGEGGVGHATYEHVGKVPTSVQNKGRQKLLQNVSEEGRGVYVSPFSGEI